MSKSEPRKKLAGPWHSLHAVIWLVGLYILISRGWIFPGIFILLAISALYEGFLQRYAPRAFEEETSSSPSSAAAPISTTSPPVPPLSTASPPVTYAASILEQRIDLLPQVCPSCNAPVRVNEVRWTGPQSANCAYCGTNLPMSKP